MNDRVVVTGTGIVCSLGNKIKDIWVALLSGKCGIRPIEDFNAQGFECQTSAGITGLNPSELGIHPRDTRIMDKHSLMLMKCSKDAFHQAQLNSAAIRGEDIGFFASMGMVDYSVEDLMPSVLNSRDSQGNLDYDAFFSAGHKEIYPLWPLSMLNNISFCQVAIELGIRGENTVFSPHSDSALEAIAEAMNSILDKKAKVALAGGVSEKVSPMSLSRASFFDILNRADNEKDQMCQPFSALRKGTILGEGCGILALELYSSAQDRGMTSLAALSGYGFAFGSSEASHCPTASAMSKAMKHAIENAGLKPSDIEVIIAHGDGTYNGDRNEIEAIHQIFGGCIDRVNVYSSKGALGHLLSGSSAVDVILGIQMFQDGTIPATCNALPAENNIMFNLVSKEPIEVHPKRIMINSWSYEGQCASLIVEAVQ